MLPFMMYNTSYKTKMCLAEFKGFAQLYCLCRRVRIRNFVFPALVTAFLPRAFLGFGGFKLRRVLFRKVPNAGVRRCSYFELGLPGVKPPGFKQLN